MNYITDKKYDAYNSETKEWASFIYVEGDWVNSETGVLYDTESLESNNWTIIPD